MSKPYHHGNLRETLIRAACDLIAQKGPQGFTLAEAAKIAGVSAAAPYRHFPSKDDLILDISEQGFALFAIALEAARKSQANPLDAMLAMGHAYLKFADEHKGEYMAMFESGIRSRDCEDRSPPSMQAFAELLAGSEAIIRNFTAKPTNDVTEVAQHIWALSHGVASLYARNSPDPNASQNAQQILENAVRIYIKGLQS